MIRGDADNADFSVKGAVAKLDIPERDGILPPSESDNRGIVGEDAKDGDCSFPDDWAVDGSDSSGKCGDNSWGVRGGAVESDESWGISGTKLVWLENVEIGDGSCRTKDGVHCGSSWPLSRAAARCGLVGDVLALFKGELCVLAFGVLVPCSDPGFCSPDSKSRPEL